MEEQRKTIRVAAAVIRRGDTVFATQRGYGDYKDWWEFPGGKLEPGETAQEALVREIREELDAAIAVGDYITTVEYDYPDFHLSMACYWCSLEADHLTLLEHEAARWLHMDELDQVDWLPADLAVVDAIRKKWWQRISVYEIYVSSFQDSDGDGCGDLNGIRQRLDYLRDLGVGAVWLTPVYASPMVDNGYDVSDYYSINPLYGTMEDMEALIREAGERGIRIVMDLVYNHTSDQCAWFIESSRSRTGPYSDWYIWRDPGPDGRAPNNWRGIFGGSAWTWCEARGQYYLHTFASAQPDLNWANPEVRKELYRVANFWLAKGVGGFRMDAIPYIKKPALLADGPADDSEGLSDIHGMTANTEGILDYLHEFKREVTAGKDIFTVAEANGVKPDELHLWVGKDGVFDMLFEFSHVNLEFEGAEVWHKAKDWKLTDLKKVLTASEAATAEDGWYPVFFENHDKPRSVSHYYDAGADSVLAAKEMALILMTLRGTPFLYQGQELGMENVSWETIGQYNDISSISQYETALREGCSEAEALHYLHRFSRDNARTPMQWDASENAGFTPGTPWLPVHGNYRAVNAAAQEKDPHSVLHWYRRLAALRRAHPALIGGAYRELFAESEEIYAFVRGNGGERLVTLANFSGKTVRYGAEALGAGGAGCGAVGVGVVGGRNGAAGGRSGAVGGAAVGGAAVGSAAVGSGNGAVGGRSGAVGGGNGAVGGGNGAVGGGNGAVGGPDGPADAGRAQVLLCNYEDNGFRPGILRPYEAVLIRW